MDDERIMNIDHSHSYRIGVTAGLITAMALINRKFLSAFIDERGMKQLIDLHESLSAELEGWVK